MFGFPRSRRARLVRVGLLGLGVLAGVAGLIGVSRHDAPRGRLTWVAPPAPSPAPVRLVVRPAPKDLPVIDYEHVPAGFPADPQPSSVDPVTAGLHPGRKVALYDAAGGWPRALLPPAISGVAVTVPIVDRRPGWVAVLLPSVDRRIGWLPVRPTWTVRRLTDLLVVRLGRHELSWLRGGVPIRRWTVATGAAATPTPVGRTFVLGPTRTDGPVYGGLDAIVLGAVPERREALAPGLRTGHTAIHSWYRPEVFGRSVSNGCVRVPREAQRTLLAQIRPGTPVVVLP